MKQSQAILQIRHTNNSSDIIQKEEDLSQVELAHIQQGRDIGNPNPVYQRVNERIETVVGAYGNRAPMDYLRGIAHNITV